jgi:anti-sigma B factor antagonist
MVQPAEGELTIERTDHGSALVYQVSGEVDTLTAPDLDRALSSIYDSPQAVSSVVLDLTNVPFLSSAGLSILVDHHSKCAREGIPLSVVAAARATVRAIQITALDRIIPLHGTVEDALAAVEAS